MCHFFLCVKKKKANLIIVEETKPHLENITNIATNKNNVNNDKNTDSS